MFDFMILGKRMKKTYIIMFSRLDSSETTDLKTEVLIRFSVFPGGKTYVRLIKKEKQRWSSQWAPKSLKMKTSFLLFHV